MKSSAKPNRYPGVSPFTAEQKALFFGREEDTQRLLELLHQEQQVLLYGKSGLGKSSLLNAGLIPRWLAEPDTACLPVRFYAWKSEQSMEPVDAVLATLPEAPKDTYLDKIIANDNSLWYRFKALQRDTTKRYLIVFDQFEELFTHPEASVFQFKKQMADLLYPVIPQRFRQVLQIRQRKTPDLLTEAELKQLNRSLDIRVLFAIREDRYSQLNQLADYLPDILHHRYQIEPLDRQHAERAIVEPAQAAGEFATDPFTYEAKALTNILDYLTSNNTQAVETTHLQILCNRLENLERSTITTSDIPNFEDIFLEFYMSSIEKLDKKYQLPARRLIEREMVKRGQRIALDSISCQEYLPQEVLDQLVRQQHLLRAELTTTGGISYELSHDTLIDPVVRARQAREAEEAIQREAEEKKALERQLAEEKEAKEAQRRQLMRTRLYLALAIVALVTSIGLGVFAGQQQEAAREEAKRAEQNLADYIEADEARRNAEVEQLIQKANNFEVFEEITLAIRALEDALKIDSTREDIQERIINLQKRK